MDAFDLHASPEWIVDVVEPRDLLAVARAAGDWDDASCATIDHVLCQWTRVAVARPDDEAGLLDLQSVVGWFGDLLPTHAKGRDHAEHLARWRGFYDVLEAHRIALAARDPDKIRARKHVGPILAALTPGEMEQKALREKLGLTESRLAQLLSVMEQHGLIARSKRGRVNVVRLAGVPDGKVAQQSGGMVQRAPTASGPRLASYLAEADSTLPRAA